MANVPTAVLQFGVPVAAGLIYAVLWYATGGFSRGARIALRLVALLILLPVAVFAWMASTPLGVEMGAPRDAERRLAPPKGGEAPDRKTAEATREAERPPPPPSAAPQPPKEEAPPPVTTAPPPPPMQASPPPQAELGPGTSRGPAQVSEAPKDQAQPQPPPTSEGLPRQDRPSPGAGVLRHRPRAQRRAEAHRLYL
jgi:hypothetical protein